MGAQVGIRRGGHTEECRKRIEEYLGDGRNEKEQDRMDHWVAAQVETGASAAIQQEDGS